MSKFFNCRKCGYRVNPGEYKHTYNQVAQENGCCCFGCLIKAEGLDKAIKLLAEYKERMHGIQESR